VIATGLFGLALLCGRSPEYGERARRAEFGGAASVAFMSRGNSLLQLTAEGSMRGRVMVLWAVAPIGTTPIGGPIIGYIVQHAGPRWGLVLGGFAALIATSLAVHARRHLPTTSAPTAPGAHDLPPGAGPS